MSESRMPVQMTVYNLVTILLVILTFGVCLGVAYLAMNPMPQPVAAEPTLFVVTTPTNTLVGPTHDPTLTATPSLTASVTPTPTETPTQTGTPAPTNTPTPTATITRTPTRTLVPTLTFTPTINTTLTTLTPTFTLVPTLTPEPGTFSQRDNTTFIDPQGVINQPCGNWWGIGGAVFGKDNQPLADIRIHIYPANGGGNVTVTSGHFQTHFGSGGYLQQANVMGLWSVEVVDSSGASISTQPVNINFTGNCPESLAVVYWKQD